MSEFRNVSVILVDDDPDEHFLFKADLEDAGISVELDGFTRTEAALDHLRTRDPAPILVLTDLSLAGSDAVAFIRDTKPYLNGGAVGVYSGARNPEMEAKCRLAGATFYIVKPVTREKLEEAIAAIESVRLVTTDDNGARLVAA